MKYPIELAREIVKSQYSQFTSSVRGNELIVRDGDEIVTKFSLRTLVYANISDVELEGIDPSDCGDFCDAYVVAAKYEGRDMTNAELASLNEDSGYVCELANAKFFS